MISPIASTLQFWVRMTGRFLLSFVIALTFVSFGFASVRADDHRPVSFKDTNFKLTVIDALMEQGILDFGPFPDFLKQIEGPQYDYENDGYDLSAKAYRYFADYPLTADQLSKVERLTFDGGLNIYPFIYPFWGGETEDFDIRSLDDLRHLPNLKAFEVISMLTGPDLAPLKAAQHLQRLDLGLVPGSWQNMQVLLTLPDLQSLVVFDTNITTPDQWAILQALRQKGVRVSVF